MSSIFQLPPGHWLANRPIFTKHGKEIANPMMERDEDYANYMHNKTRVKELVEKIIACPAAKKLFDQANSVPDRAGEKRNWNIEFVKKIGPKKDDKDLTEFDDRKGYIFSMPSNSGACCNPDKRTIYISDEFSDRETLGLAIFELTNALQSEKHDAVHNKALKGQISCEDFVEQSETIEFEGNFIVHEIIQEGIKNHKWTVLTQAHGSYENLPFYENLHSYMKDRSEIKNYYEKSYKFTAHADYYRKSWERITGQKSEVLAKKSTPPQKATSISR